jgi:pimeloyl-ACP methyl ester carboxylesterase
VAPRTANEIALALVWAEVLSVKKIGLHDNFFDLGGHSLLAMKAIVGFRERTGCKLDPRNFYQQTLGQLAATLEPMPATPLEADTIAMLRLDPFYFGSQERPLFGLQRHPVAPRGIGVVLCAPHAHEYVRCHRALRELAQRYARQGYHALSFDYFGTGDSGGRYEQVDPKDWADDVVMAIDALRERCGLSRVILVGLRLGATLAMSAAIRRSDVCAVVLWDPIISGTDYQLELEEIIYWQQLDASRLREIPRPDVLSFLLTPTAEKILREIDLAGQANLLLPPTLLLQTGDDTKGRAAQLCRSNAAIEYRRLEDANIWLREPYEAVVPHQVLNAILEWTVEMRP